MSNEILISKCLNFLPFNYLTFICNLTFARTGMVLRRDLGHSWTIFVNCYLLTVVYQNSSSFKIQIGVIIIMLR